MSNSWNEEQELMHRADQAAYECLLKMEPEWIVILRALVDASCTQKQINAALRPLWKRNKCFRYVHCACAYLRHLKIEGDNGKSRDAFNELPFMRGNQNK